MVQERRSMLRVWNVTLVILTFFLTIFGTFMTRSGVVQSVHAFGDDPMLARLFTIFMVVIITFSFGLVIYRLPLLKARNEFDSWMSREAAFLANNWILLFSAMFIVFVTMFPTLSEAVTGTRLTVAAPFYNKWMIPIGLMLLLLTGIGPLLAWRKSTFTNLASSFMWPAIATVVTSGVVLALRIRFWSSGLCFALCAFVTATIVQEFWRGGNVRRRNTGTDVFTAIVGLVGRNKRRYGGYIVHLGIVLIFLGFAGNGSQLHTIVQLKPGDQTTLGAYTIRHDGVKVSDDGQRQMTTGTVSIFKGGNQIDTMYPGRSVFRKHENEEARSDVAIRRTPAEDLYIVLTPDVDFSTQTVSYELYVNPLVDWIWLGFGVLAFGTGIALLPERAYSFAVAKLPAEIATSTVALLVVLLLGSTSLSAQMHVPNASGPVTAPKNALDEQLRHEMGCVCGGCAHEPLTTCTCSTAQQMRSQLREQIDLGKNHDEVIQAFVGIYGGQQFLQSPIDKGFNRIAWLFPYLIGATGIVAIGFAAVKWSRHSDAETTPAAPVDAELDERITDELRDLD
jgi:cytochrome c-type biogenesis protein CcmF